VAWDAHPGATVPSRGVPARRRIAALAATLAVTAAPGVALAQNGAGDEQYEDPFQSTPAPKATTKPKPTPVQPVPHQQVQTPEQQPEPTATATQTGAGEELPRTGLDLAPLALAGIALVAAGLVLRRRAGHGRD
jgi:LPXTG-motif cell wall-anchored protein